MCLVRLVVGRACAVELPISSPQRLAGGLHGLPARLCDGEIEGFWDAGVSGEG